MTVYRDRLGEMLAAAPSLASSPGIALSLASSSVATDRDAQLVAATNKGLEYASYLSKLEGRSRDDAWARMSEEQRGLAYHLGNYRPGPPPNLNENDQGWFGNAVEGVVNVGKGLGTAAMTAIDEVLAPVDWLGEQVTHGQRTGIVVGKEWGAPDAALPLAGLAGSVVSPVANMFGQDDFVRAWSATQKVEGFLRVTGDDYFDEQYLTQVRHRYSPETFELGMRIARGEDRMDIIAKETDPERAARLQSMLRTDALQGVVEEIDAAKLSLGRQVARNWLGLLPTDENWHRVSGTVDAANRILLDPTLIGGKLHKTWQLGKYGMGSLNATRVDELFQQKSVQKYFDGATEQINKLALNTDDAGRALEVLNTQYRNMGPDLRNQLVDFSRKSGGNIGSADVHKFFSDITNTIELRRGQAAYREPLMLRKSRFEEHVTDRVRAGIRKPISWLEESGGLAERLEVYDGPSSAAKAAITRLRNEQADNPDLERMIDEVLTQDRYQSVGRKTAALRGGDRVSDDEFTRAERVRFRVAQTMSRFSEKVAVGNVEGRFDMTAPDATEQVYRMARPFLTRKFALDLAADFDAADISGKRNIMAGLKRSIGEAAGLGKTEEGRALLRKLVDDDNDPTRAYSGFDQDKLADGRKVGVMSWQMQTHTTMPHYRELHAASAKIGVLSHFGGFVTAPLLDKAMHYWRGSVLINARRPFREAGEEALGHSLRYGMSDLFSGWRLSRLVDPSVKKAEREAQQGIIRDTVAEDIHLRVKDADGVGVGDDAKRYLAQLDMDAIETYEIAVKETGRKAGRINDAGVDEGSLASAFSQQRRVGIAHKGEWETRDVNSLEGVRAWAHLLQKMAGSQDGRTALKNIEDEQASIGALADLIQSDGWAKFRKGAELYREGLEISGTEVGAARHWAQRIYNEVRGHFSDPDGNLLDDLIADVRKVDEQGNVFIDLSALNMDRLKEIDKARRPRHVVAPVLVHVDDQVGMIDSLMSKGYEAVASANHYISRSPIYWSNWVEARRSLQGWEDELAKRTAVVLRKEGMDAGKAEHLAQQQAIKSAMRQADRMAVERTLGTVDNPEVRSQFSVIARNMIPFWRAQEEFYRRWGRTVRYHPMAIRKAALTYEGLEHSGFIQTDTEGNDYFVYPGTNEAAELMFRVGKLFGQNWAMSPTPFTLKGQVRFLNSGFDPNNIQPSFGPLAAAPLKAMTHFLPESQAVANLERLALGDQAAGREFLGGLIPTDMRRLMQATGTFGQTKQLESLNNQRAAWYEYEKRKQLQEHGASAIIRQAQVLEALGMTPAEDADDIEIEMYRDRLANGSRAVLLLRALFGAFLPAAPESEDMAPAIQAFRGEAITNVKDEFLALRAKVGYEKAYELWVKAHPDELPLLTSQSKSVSGAVLPVHDEAGEFYEENRGLFRQFPRAAAFLLPHADGAKFDPDTYRLWASSKMSRKRDFKEFYLDMKLSGYTGHYYKTKEKFETAAAEASANGDNESARAINAQWDTYSKQYQDAHPLLKKYIGQGGQRNNDRELIADEVRRMALSGRGQHLPGMAAVRQIVETYDEYTAARSQLGGSNTREARAIKDVLRSRYTARMSAIADADLNAEMLYSRIFRYMED